MKTFTLNTLDLVGIASTAIDPIALRAAKFMTYAAVLEEGRNLTTMEIIEKVIASAPPEAKDNEIAATIVALCVVCKIKHNERTAGNN